MGKITNPKADLSPDLTRRLPMPAVPEGISPLVGVKLWQNPCRLSYRLNFIAHQFNQPVYDWIARFHQLTRPEHVILYAIGLREGITAEDIGSSSSQPRNTLSRAVNGLVRRGLISRVLDKKDGRRRLLYITGAGRQILDETVPLMMAREEALLDVLSIEERETLNHLMTKMILSKTTWPTRLDNGEKLSGTDSSR